MKGKNLSKTWMGIVAALLRHKIEEGFTEGEVLWIMDYLEKLEVKEK